MRNRGVGGTNGGARSHSSSPYMSWCYSSPWQPFYRTFIGRRRRLPGRRRRRTCSPIRASKWGGNPGISISDARAGGPVSPSISMTRRPDKYRAGDAGRCRTAGASSSARTWMPASREKPTPSPCWPGACKGPVTVQLQIERAGKPYDRAAASEEQTITPEAWTELHVTFTVDEAFPGGLVRLRELRTSRRPNSAWTCSAWWKASTCPTRSRPRRGRGRRGETVRHRASVRRGVVWRALDKRRRLDPSAGRPDRPPFRRRRGARERSPGAGSAARAGRRRRFTPGGDRASCRGPLGAAAV